MGLRINTLVSNAFSLLKKKKAESGEQSRIISLDEIRPTASPRPLPSKNINLSNQIRSIISLGQLGLNESESESQAAKNRADSIEGIGNRNINVEINKLSLGTKSFQNSVYDSLPQENSVGEPTQQEILQLRNAVLERAERAVQSNPQLSDEELESAVDQSFSEGTAQIFNIRTEDIGKGQTNVLVDQIEYSKLFADEKQMIQEASANAQLNYQKQDLKPIFHGEDIQHLVSQIEDVLAYEGLAVTEIINKGLTSGDIEKNLEEARTEAENLGNTEAVSLISKLQVKVNESLSSFDKDPLSDSAQFKFRSGRYELAFGKSEVEASAALTENSSDRSPVFRKF